MPENPYDDRKVSLRRPHRNGDLDIVGTSYTRGKANVTEALGMDHVNIIYEHYDTMKQFYKVIIDNDHFMVILLKLLYKISW